MTINVQFSTSKKKIHLFKVVLLCTFLCMCLIRCHVVLCAVTSCDPRCALGHCVIIGVTSHSASVQILPDSRSYRNPGDSYSTTQTSLSFLYFTFCTTWGLDTVNAGENTKKRACEGAGDPVNKRRGWTQEDYWMLRIMGDWEPWAHQYIWLDNYAKKRLEIEKLKICKSFLPNFTNFSEEKNSSNPAATESMTIRALKLKKNTICEEGTRFSETALRSVDVVVQ